MTTTPRNFSRDYALRGLIVAVAGLLRRHYTFNEIAELLYKGGVIDKAERPYGSYQGSKSDYVKERLAHATGDEPFFRYVIPEIFWNIDATYISGETKDLETWAVRFGYRVEEEEVHDGLFLRDLVPPRKKSSRPQISEVSLHADKEYPDLVLSLIKQLNDNIRQSNLDAVALLIRRLIFVSCIIYMKKANRENDIVGKDGDYKKLSLIVDATIKRVPDISKELTSRLRIAKWTSDEANHVLNWSIRGDDVNELVYALDRFLSCLFKNTKG